MLRPATPSTVGSPKAHPRNWAAVRTDGLTAPSCPVSSRHSPVAAGAVRLGEAADAAGPARPPAVVLVVVVLRLGPLRPRLRIARLRLLGAGVVGQPACFVLGPGDGVGEHAGVQHGGRRWRRCRDRSGHHGRDRRRHQGRGPLLGGQGQFLAGRRGAGAGQGDGTAGDGDGRRRRQPHSAQHGRGHGYADGGCLRRMACAVPSRMSRPAGTGGSGRAAASGGAMPSHDQPSGLDGTAGRPVREDRRVGSPVSIQ